MNEAAAPTDALSGVARTLLIPLAIRAMASRDPAKAYADPVAEQAASRIGQDLSRYTSEWSMNQSVLARTHLLDRLVTEFLAEQPESTVVNLGAGLCTRSWRVDNGRMRWVSVDLPEVIEARAALLPEAPRRQAIAGSVFEEGWLEELKPAGPMLFLAEGLFIYFDAERVSGLLRALARHVPGARLLFENGHPRLIRSRFSRRSKLLEELGVRFTFGIARPAELGTWVEGVEVERTWPMMDSEPAGWGLSRLALKFFPEAYRAYGIVDARLGAVRDG